MKPLIKELIDAKDFTGLERSLSENPALANEGLPFDNVNTTKAHPLHRICDGVMSGTYTDEDAVKMATIFLRKGAHVNGNVLVEGQDSPLVAASSLHADKVALLYIDNGAELNHPGGHGGTALHWAAWCGRPLVVEKLIAAGADIHKKSMDYQATPLSWALHHAKEVDKKELPGYAACIKMLLQAGANRNMPDDDRKTMIDLFGNEYPELKEALN